MPFSPANSEFFVEKQESLAVDKFSKNGASKELHIVAKSIPFVIHVASSLDLNNSAFEAKLIYDAEDEKEVETVKSEPMEFVVHVNSMGDKAAVEIRIFVLSSQHEGAFFRVKLSITEKDSEQTFVTFSNPIKVVSKRNQVKKMLERNELSREDNPHIEVAPVANKRPAPSSPTSDSIQEVLLRLEQQQREQAQILRQLVSQKNNPVSFDCGTVPSPNDMDFESAFQNFLAAFQKVPSSERTSKLRKVMQNVEVCQPMNDFLDVANTECGRNMSESLMQSIFTLPSGNSDDINCQYSNCPPKNDTDQLDTFYNDFFQEPLTPPAVGQMMISS